ncbi:hypothetical protein H6P81_001272 [Aristolochia fimbriata]|uniref:Uncharacterized protein n=1 Tax=Aristolochia fimbriata TaxID=158543 RepID=A0AAV7F728_ARIFI|nr:hypothetical protein H6P81_001272 [Aristolochia fimbriata]
MPLGVCSATGTSTTRPYRRKHPGGAAATAVATLEKLKRRGRRREDPTKRVKVATRNGNAVDGVGECLLCEEGAGLGRDRKGEGAGQGVHVGMIRLPLTNHILWTTLTWVADSRIFGIDGFSFSSTNALHPLFLPPLAASSDQFTFY